MEKLVHILNYVLFNCYACLDFWAERPQGSERCSSILLPRQILSRICWGGTHSRHNQASFLPSNQTEHLNHGFVSFSRVAHFLESPFRNISNRWLNKWTNWLRSILLRSIPLIDWNWLHRQTSRQINRQAALYYKWLRYCQPEAAVLLASYAVQAAYGDIDDEIELHLEKLLPASVINHYDLSAEMWKERIRSWWAKNGGLSM